MLSLVRPSRRSRTAREAARPAANLPSDRPLRGYRCQLPDSFQPGFVSLQCRFGSLSLQKKTAREEAFPAYRRTGRGRPRRFATKASLIVRPKSHCLFQNRNFLFPRRGPQTHPQPRRHPSNTLISRSSEKKCDSKVLISARENSYFWVGADGFFGGDNASASAEREVMRETFNKTDGIHKIYSFD
jgi:hypothetical protein